MTGVQTCALPILLPTWAANGDANILSATPSYAALFKNGVGLVMSKVDLPDASGEFRITPFPDATLGSFWVHWGDGIRLEKIKATQVESNERVSAASVMDMMEANVGKEVELWIQDRKEWGRYTILDVPKRHDDPIVFPRSANVIPLPPPMDRGDLVLLQGPESKEAIPLGWVQAIRMYAEDHINRPKMENMVSLTSLPGTTGSPKDVSLTYLAKGIAWSPSYVLDISQEKKATITAKAVIVNDLQPLEHTHVELIAGYPNIAFSESNSSFSLVPLQETLAKIGAMAGRAEMPFSNAAVLTQRAFAMDVNAPPMPSAPMIPVMGESAEDLYFYPIQDVTLKKGERGYYPLFAEEVPYEHLYTWDIPNYLNENAP